MLKNLGRFASQSCVIMGHERGHNADSRLKHNFGMAKPEGYRKAQPDAARRAFRVAGHYSIDTSGAFPGVDMTRERGRSYRAFD